LCYSSESKVDFFIAEDVGHRGNPEHEVLMNEKWLKDVRKIKLKYYVARRGDHLMTPFECDVCIFCKLTLRNGPHFKTAGDFD
jgi:hypothetical protein